MISHAEVPVSGPETEGKGMSTRARKVQVWIYRKSPENRRKTEVLLLLTTPQRGGFWQPVTGGVDADEKLEDAARREAQEETRLRFLGMPRPIGEDFEFESRGIRFRESGFVMEADPASEVMIDPKEHVEYRWIEANDAIPLLRFPSNAAILRALLNAGESIFLRR